ncbi:MAG TPA: PH domain-containing protein, partial [Dehalococcoidia bacterium]
GDMPPVTEKFPFPLQSNEVATMVCRRHWMYLWPRTIFWALLALIPAGVVFWLISSVDAFDSGPVRTVLLIAALLWLAFWAVRMVLNWYVYHNDIWVITNQRLIDSYKRTPFNHMLSTADLVNLQDMTVHRRGILQTTLDYGDVVCQTAGSRSRDFVLTGVPHPQEVQLFVDKERDRERMRGR